jgi:hypothetical protein
MVIVLLILASFTTLNVVVDESHLRIKFGYGIYKKGFTLADMASVKTIRNHWYYGWGIRIWFWPHMIIFNISGFDTVEIVTKQGKTYRIGTDEPQQLQQVLLQSIR